MSDKMNIHLACIVHHKWNGCLCERCGKVRDMEHDWVNCICRRCGHWRNESHYWRGCVCSVCKMERHRWHQGVCVICCTACDHGFGSESDLEPNTAHGSLVWICIRCKKKIVETMPCVDSDDAPSANAPRPPGISA